MLEIAWLAQIVQMVNYIIIFDLLVALNGNEVEKNFCKD